jgi:outer membrane protein TolC
MLSPFAVPRIVPGDARRRAWAVAAATALLLIANGAVAAGSPLSLAEALRMAVERSPQLASQRAMVDAAREMAGPAGELPDPKLRLGVENVPTNGADSWSLTRDFMTMSKIGVMQEFPREAKRKLRSQRAENDAQRGEVAVEAARLVIQRETASAWLSRWFAAEVERAIGSQIGEAELAVTAASAAYRAGRAPQGELIAAQSQVIELRNRATDAAAQSRRARIGLARYIGADAERPLGDPPDLARLPFDAARLYDVDGQPEIRLARAQEAIAATEADLARASKEPDWSAELTYAVRGAPYSNMVSLMVSIDLPWSQGTRQDREHAAKLKELDAARAMREDVRRMRVAEVGGMLAEWESARTQAKRISEEMLPLAAQRREAALAAYRGGSGTLAAVLEARRAELDARLAFIAQEQAAAKAWAWLQFVLPVTEKS